jgi:hypothetical protein
MRRVSVIFCSISSLKFDSSSVLGLAQKAMTITQDILKKYEGTLRQFIVDGTWQENNSLYIVGTRD